MWKWLAGRNEESPENPSSLLSGILVSYPIRCGLIRVDFSSLTWAAELRSQ
jgi:hypothetical protein